MKLCIHLLAVGVLLIAMGALGVETHVDLWESRRQLQRTLLKPDADLAALVNQVLESPPENGQAAMTRLFVLLRAGANKEAAVAVQDIRRHLPDLAAHEVSQLYYIACDQFQAWDAAQTVVEVFADRISQVQLEGRLLKHFENSGWSIEQVDRWLASKPRGVDGFWVKERLRFNTRHKREEAVLQELMDRARANPADATETIALLDGVIYARVSQDTQPDLAWIADIIQPGLATGAADIASRLAILGSWESAIAFYRQAIALPLTNEETQHLAAMRQAMISDDSMRAQFAAQTREELAKCLLKLDQADEAQEWMLEASEIRKRHGLGENLYFAGEVQRASGQRIVEERIKAEEETSADDPAYWLERANYYNGRDEAALEENALTNALALTVPKPEPERRGKGTSDMRSRVLRHYVFFLHRKGRDPEAVALLRTEIAESPAGSESSVQAAQMLAYTFPTFLSVEDDVLWRWLGERPTWDNPEQRLVWRMLERASSEDLDTWFDRAEKLALGNHPGRASTLGWIQNRMGFAQRSIPLLTYAVENEADEEKKRQAMFTLFESYLATEDWQRAEAVFPEAAQRLTPGEWPGRCSRIAVLAAQAGAEEDAMRIWKQVANVDLTATGAVDELAAAGLTNELVDFYRGVQKAIPSSEIPARVLESLGKQKETNEMTVEEFDASVATENQPPAGLSEPLRALWYAAKGDWEQAHTVSQDITNSDGSWIHAHLHREEGDIGNARYWYSRSGHPESKASIEEERRELIAEFCAR